MKSNLSIARQEAKKLIIKHGMNNILNKHVNEVCERTGVTCTDMQNAFSYFKYSPSQEKFRLAYS